MQTKLERFGLGGLRWSGRHHLDNLRDQGAIGEDLPGMEGPGGLEEKRNCVEGEMWGHGRGQREGQKPLRGGRF